MRVYPTPRSGHPPRAGCVFKCTFTLVLDKWLQPWMSPALPPAGRLALGPLYALGSESLPALNWWCQPKASACLVLGQARL